MSEPTVLRRWTGWIEPEDRTAYQDYLEETGLSAYRATDGNLGAWATYRDLPDGRCEVVTLSLWRSRADIEEFAGSDISRAVFYPEDDRFLVGRETTVDHFDVGTATHDF
ncbi:MAG TPA: hypothetical protein VEX57_14235 [Microlunatus sp.]|nr:hypothetical protein [Microlunatus sp.]